MSNSHPEGELVSKTIAMPMNANRYGDIFGGWLVSQMDLGGAVLAHACAQNRMTTVAIDKMVFIRPVFIGDVVSCYAKIAKRGNTSVAIQVDVWVDRMKDESKLKVTTGIFTYVSIDPNGHPTPIKWHDK
jgi:acyl-CoA thioesterase YciA